MPRDDADAIRQDLWRLSRIVRPGLAELDVAGDGARARDILLDELDRPLADIARRLDRVAPRPAGRQPSGERLDEG